MIKFIASFFNTNPNLGMDLSKHRAYTTLYQDLCM